MLACPSVILGHEKFENHGDKHGTDHRLALAGGRKKKQSFVIYQPRKTINHTSIICSQVQGFKTAGFSL